MSSWEICCEGERVAYYTSYDEENSEEVLGNVIAIWTRDIRGVIEWDEAGKMASIAYHYTDLSPSKIEAIFRITGEKRKPSGPPWELSHPIEESSIRIQRPEE